EPEVPDKPAGPARLFSAGGIASWYGPGFIGRKTATGETFDSEGLTAASRNLPLRSLIRVTNPRNGRSVVVRINDRGPYVKARSIDLSRRAADLLGILRPGVAPVTLSMLDASGVQRSSETVDVQER